MPHRRAHPYGIRILAIMLLLCCGVASADEDTPQLESWIDHAADGFAGGTGTANDPYLIATAEQLAYLANTTNEGNDYKDKHFKLLQDIDLARYDWVAIGTRSDNLFEHPLLRKEPAFLGNFDGDNKVIRNLTTKNPFAESGLFGLLALAEIKNLALVNVDIQSSFMGGGLAAQSHGSTIKNCYVSGKVKGFWCLGGIVGFSLYADVYECLVNVEIYLSDRPMPRELELHRAKYFPPYTGHSLPLYNVVPVAGGVIGYAGNALGPTQPIKIDRCIVASKIHGGEQRWINAIAVPEPGAFLTITNCEIIKDFRMDEISLDRRF